MKRRNSKMKNQKYRVSKKKIDNDRIMTPLDYCTKLVEHFEPHGIVLDPCSGTGKEI